MIDPKYIRYTKHNRDKGSWLCVAHYNLRKTHRSIRKSIAVLAGRWSEPSKALVRSFGVEALEVPFDHMAEVLREYGVEFEWPESGGEPVARRSFKQFSELDDETRAEIGGQFVAGIADRLRDEVVQVLDTDISSITTQVAEIEILLKTDQNEMVLSSFSSVSDAIRALADLVSDRPDIRAFIERQ